MPNAVSDTKLLPCPFCGETPVVMPLRVDRSRWKIECGNICPIVLNGTDREAVVTRWNTRALTSSPQAWVCAKCGAGSVEHGMLNHPASQCVYEPTLITVPGALTPKQAAADEMYEALKEAKEFIENQQLPDAEWSRILDVAVAAITKAGR